MLEKVRVYPPPTPLCQGLPFSTHACCSNTSFPGLPSSQPVQLGMLYLSSYEGMGIAQVSCVRGCQCEPRTVDAHQGKYQVGCAGKANPQGI